ncbi:MAG: C40 family peptidase [Actinobacteria bacterium]|nr:C40 family peptidase [Actinomycetota bacterium]
MRVVVIALALVLVINVAPSFAKSPKPTLAQIEAAKKAEAAKRAAARAAAEQLAQANQNLRVLTSKADNARARYVSALAALADARKVSQAATLHALQTTASVAAAHRVIGQLASNAYIMGGGLTDIEPLLNSNGPQDLIDQLSNLNTLGANNSTALDRYKAAEVVARQAQAEADAAKLAQQRATYAVAVAKKSADDAKAAQQTEVDALQKVQEELIRQLASAKQVRITLEQQRQLALLEEAQAKQAEQTPGQAKIWPDIGFKGKSTVRTTQAQQLIAVEYARKQVLAKKPYVWGAQGPNSFDCSGLVYAAFKAAGLGWPNWDRLNAALYAGYVKHVSLDSLQPGDLLFYSYKGTISTIHHMSIYAGNGMVWEARSTKTGLRYSNMYSVSGLMPFGGRV